MKKQVSKKSGFTLIELMVVVIIVGILAAVAIPMMSANKRKSIGSEAVATLGTLNTANKLYKVATGNYANDVNTLITGGYVQTDDLDGTYFDNVDYTGSASWDNTNEKFVFNTAVTDNQNGTHVIVWDTTGLTYTDSE
jgi:prepilin-type N-terminal cleavage/methylation domain-containing protein